MRVHPQSRHIDHDAALGHVVLHVGDGLKSSLEELGEVEEDGGEEGAVKEVGNYQITRARPSLSFRESSCLAGQKGGRQSNN